ncbi:hypothetical protein CC78DRAFT_575159 [Lojkania enalia]|uniref:Uncharacterized protein n=1 Tax=Lojkania enalia TaxID=147567 RepID=A0A9P4TNQ7_9PLEO|nr:hypothetical protein CC78DRAFT_575159 [Didymosphaeria enalia]
MLLAWGRCHVPNIFLSGSLSSNEYVVKMIKHLARGLVGKITIRKANGLWSAIAQEIVLTGAGIGVPLPLKVSSAPKYCGISLSHAYEVWKLVKETNVDVDKYGGTRMAHDFMTWMVQQGDLILMGTSLTKYIAVRCRFAPKRHEKNSCILITCIIAAIDRSENSRNISTRSSEIPDL